MGLGNKEIHRMPVVLVEGHDTREALDHTVGAYPAVSLIADWIAHSIESVMLKRNFFADEERLYEIGKAYECHPLFEILSDMLGENVQRIPYEHYVLEGKATYLVDIEANEPNVPIRVTVTSDKPVSIKRVDKDISNPPAKEVSMLQKLRKAYWDKYRSGQW